MLELGENKLHTHYFQLSLDDFDGNMITSDDTRTSIHACCNCGVTLNTRDIKNILNLQYDACSERHSI